MRRAVALVPATCPERPIVCLASSHQQPRRVGMSSEVRCETMENRKIRMIASLCVFLLVSIVGVLNAQGQFKVGDPFPNITLPSLADGQPDSIENYRGSKIILHIFASW